MEKILIVDDQIITLKMTSHILSTRYETFCALSGEEAIEIYKKERPDMILSDLNMPTMSGFELQSTLQNMFLEHIPVMFMTADNSDDTETKGFENGAVDYIRKPFRADVLLKRVENILNNEKRIQGLRRAAETDPMTGLLNKASSQFEIGEACSKMNGMLMMIDLDSFKLVNDLYGHAMGDKVLIRFAEIICSAVRSSDIVGRMGGDEFIAFCQYVDDEEVVAEKARYINEEVMKSAKEFMGEDMTIPLGASIGAVAVPAEGTDFLTLYQKADKALYVVKQNGKHGYCLYGEHQHQDDNEEGLQSGIQKEIAILRERNRKKGAMVLNGEQFSLVYRFLARAYINYHRENKLVLFTLSGEEGLSLEQEPAKMLMDVISHSLRSSDVVTLRNRNTVAVIILEASTVDLDVVIDRLRGKWSNLNTGMNITYEVEQIG
ncbi:MAG: diguanylate cyclase [Pseudobutyrivibrio ruminis]|nr:diguanylate cyclase [Pseudobutyrivibrio ruminis]